MTKWIKVANVGSGLEADLVVERLRGAGLHARAQGDVGMFGAGFKGTTARGFDVYVLNGELAAAREILDELKDVPDEAE